MSAQRYEVSTTVGPCSEAEVEALMEAILEAPEAKTVGIGAVSCRVCEDDE